MKKIFALGIIGLCLGNVKVIAQHHDHRSCDTDIRWQEVLKEHPEVQEKRRLIRQLADQYKSVAEKRVSTAGTILYRIPIVFHVIHEYGQENISKAQIVDGLNIMNQSFSRLNPDTADVIPLFEPIFANCEIEFVLANIDPDGNCTDGITRTYSPLSGIADDDVKDLIRWPNEQYFNVWVVKNIASGAAGYAYYPGAPSDIDGVVIRHDYLGSFGTSNSSNYSERAMTHEAGHWLNLPHTWGSTNTPGSLSNCNTDDGIFDTPNTVGVDNFSCNLAMNTCGPIANVQNYMDYGSCPKMFTEGQKDEMHSVLNTNLSGRNNLWTPSNLQVTGTEAGHIVQTCSPRADFAPFVRTICEGQPLGFSDKSWNADIISRTWIFNGGTPATDTSANPTVIYNTSGTYDVMLVVNSATGTDTLVQPNVVQVLPAQGATSVPFSDGFENYISFPVNGWGIENAGNNLAFNVSSNAAATGTKSIRITSPGGSQSGSEDAIVSPTFNFNGVTGAVLTFKTAFAPRNSSDVSSVRVLVSRDCGTTWQQRFVVSGANLHSAPASTANFTPNASQWVTRTVSLASSIFSNKPNIRVKIVYNNDQGNSLYIDDVNISAATTGINETIAEELAFRAWPNPASEAMNVRFELPTGSDVLVELMDLSGRFVRTELFRNQPAGVFNTLLASDKLNGMYLLRIQAGDYRFTQRVSFID
jgi:PKD repeat protein